MLGGNYSGTERERVLKPCDWLSQICKVGGAQVDEKVIEVSLAGTGTQISSLLYNAQELTYRSIL